MIKNLLRKHYNLTKVRWYVFKVSFLPKIGFQVRSKKHSLDSALIVSLTSYPKRFEQLHLTLMSLLNQTIRPDKIVLWIAKDDMSQLPLKVINLEKKGISILQTEDILSYKKIIPTLKEYPNNFIITVDDDLYYHPTLIEELIDTSKRYPNEVIASRTHLMKFDSNNQLLPYSKWGWLEFDNAEGNHNFFTSGAGTLFPPNCFYKDISQKELFMKLAPHADDVWLNWMVRLNKKQVYCTNEMKPIVSWQETQDEALWHSNVGESGNDLQITRMVEHYQFPKNGIATPFHT